MTPRMRVDATDIIGRTFTLLTVERLLPRPRPQRSRCNRYIYRYECRCTCGEQCVITRGNLLSAHARSCGCLKRRKGSANPGWKGHGDISGYHWARIRNHGRSRQLPFTITLREAWELFQQQRQRCALTGWTLQLGLSSKTKSTCTASLDRIDSERGYVRGNIQWVHKDVNQIKWDLPSQRFIEVCTAVATHASRSK